jgi:hypothetical protein
MSIGFPPELGICSELKSVISAWYDDDRFSKHGSTSHGKPTAKQTHYRPALNFGPILPRPFNRKGNGKISPLETPQIVDIVPGAA